MSEQAFATSEYRGAAQAAADAPIATQPTLPGLPAPPAVHPAYAAIIQTAQQTSAPIDYGQTAASYMVALDPYIQAGEAIGRASPKTSAYIALGEAAIPLLAGLISRFFPHPQG